MKKRRKNPHAVALGRLGGLVRGAAKRRAIRENGRKGGLVKSRKKRIAARQNARHPAARAAPQVMEDAAITSNRVLFGSRVISCVMAETDGMTPLLDELS